jgi:NitT/TauT family transport system substrate-binding protein
MNVRQEIRRTALVIAGVVAIVIAAVYGAGRAQPLREFRVTLVTWPGWGPVHLASKKGFFASEGLDVKTSIIEDEGARVAALVSGSVELGGGTLDTIPLRYAQGIRTKIVNFGDFSYGGDGIIAKKTIRTLADLRGKRVAISEGRPNHFYLLYLLDRERIKPSEMTLVPTEEPGKAGFTFLAGHVDAAVTWEPWLTRAAQRPDSHVIRNTQSDPDILLSVFVVREDRIPELKADLKRFFRAWYRALDYWKKNDEESVKIMADAFGLPPGTFKGMAADMKMADYDYAKQLIGAQPGEGRIYEILRLAARLWQEAGLLKQPIESTQMLDPSILADLYR